MPTEGRLTDSADYAVHIGLRCKKCGARFHTKNIAPLGCRNIFYTMAPGELEKCLEHDAQNHRLEDLEIIERSE